MRALLFSLLLVACASSTAQPERPPHVHPHAHAGHDFHDAERWAQTFDDEQIPSKLITPTPERLSYHAYFAGSILNRVLCFGIMPLLRFGSAPQKELLLEDLRESHRHLGAITGEFDIESLYDRIFSTFCIGK